MLLQHRYHAPFLLLGLLLIAAAAGRLRPVPRALLLALAMVAPVAGNLEIFSHLRPDVHQLMRPIIDHTWFDGIVYRRLSIARVKAAHSTDRLTDAALRRLEGYVAADIARTAPDVRGQLSGDAVSAYWQCRTDPKQAWQDIALLNGAVLADPDPVAAGRGAAVNLAWDAPRAELTRLLRAGIPDGAPCLLCAAAGMRMGWSCHDAACLRPQLTGPDAAELAYGAGLACAEADACSAIAAGLGPFEDAYRAGATSALAGQGAPFYPQRAPKAGRAGVMPERDPAR